MTTREDVLREADQHRVGLNGYILGRHDDGRSASASFSAAEIDFVEQIERARVWIRRFSTRRTINRTMTSRLISVKVARETGGPMAQGCFIIACILEDVGVRQVNAEDPEAYTMLSFKVSTNSLEPVLHSA